MGLCALPLGRNLKKLHDAIAAAQASWEMDACDRAAAEHADIASALAHAAAEAWVRFVRFFITTFRGCVANPMELTKIVTFPLLLSSVRWHNRTSL